jgi:hypothetical protein
MGVFAESHVGHCNPALHPGKQQRFLIAVSGFARSPPDRNLQKTSSALSSTPCAFACIELRLVRLFLRIPLAFFRKPRIAERCLAIDRLRRENNRG